MGKALAYISLYRNDPTDLAEVQKQACQRLFLEELQQRGFERLEYFFDRVDKKSPAPFIARTGSHELLNTICRGDILLIPVLFRAWPRLHDFITILCRLESLGAYLHVLNFQTPPELYLNSAFIPTLKTIVSLFQVNLEEAIRKSNVRALQKKLALRVKPTFGFKRVGSIDHGKIVRDDVVRSIAGIIVNLVEAGFSWETIACKLTDAGIVNERSKNKSHFTPAGVRLWYRKEMELRHKERRAEKFSPPSI